MKKLEQMSCLCMLVVSLFACSKSTEEVLTDDRKVYPTEEQPAQKIERAEGTLFYHKESNEWMLSGEIPCKYENHAGNAYMRILNMDSAYELHENENVCYTGEVTYQYYQRFNALSPYVYTITLADIYFFESEPAYQVAELTITTENQVAITSKTTYVNCTINLDSPHDEWDYSGTSRIRGRGNSTWLWYAKKPYRIKLDQKASILGLKEERDWVLLANYRDPTNIMNVYAFTVANAMKLPYSNHSRWVNVTLNGSYIGLYQLTEQVEQGKSRVNVSDEGGILISLDADDGPELSPDATDNFWSSVYHMPICVKYPEEPEAVTSVQLALAKLEQAIKEGNYDEVAKQLNIASFIDFVLLQELTYNVELNAPRSMNMHKEVDGLWTMGPVWDFDAGFDFDWTTMYTGHNYFSSHKELIMGTDPANRIGGFYGPAFFSDMFKMKRFVTAYKERWSEIKSTLLENCWQETNYYVRGASLAMEKDAIKWPIGKSSEVEIATMKRWLENRIAYLDIVIMNYPMGTK